MPGAPQEEGRPRRGRAEGRLKPLPMGDRFGLPDLGVGVGLRTVHFGHILSKAVSYTHLTLPTIYSV